MCTQGDSNPVATPYTLDVYKVVRLSGGKFKSLFPPEDRGVSIYGGSPGTDIVYTPGDYLTAPTVEMGYYVYTNKYDAMEAAKYWNRGDKTVAVLHATVMRDTPIIYGLDAHIHAPRLVLRVKELHVRREICEIGYRRVSSDVDPLAPVNS